MKAALLQAKPKRKAGRPESRNWAEIKPAIENLVNTGHSAGEMALMFGLSDDGMRNVLTRLGIKTRSQQSRERARELNAALGSAPPNRKSRRGA